ncbi:synaptosomal-associated protein 29 [Achroia grisella]|uniref:synaptosomal-associated protein 29 n=1 Tax=Achroia grisella TaxID=688607 RepID=UPI0027D28BDA|nr:synaptosomal-associated protein 29 [Achroia grisella]
MAGHKYINSNNLFEDDVDDDTFVNSYSRNRIPPPQPKPTSPYGGHISDLERQRQAMIQRQQEIEQRTLDSSSRSIGLLRESEQIGIATAEELARQRDVLQNTNTRLDKINTDLNDSQRHLNGIKSVFYGLKNYISGKSEKTPPRSQMSPSSSSMQAGPATSGPVDTLDKLESTGDSRYDAHPSVRLRGLDMQTNQAVPNSQRVNQMLDANLDEMAHAISRLKGLGTALGDEIESQNKLLDTIYDKVENTDVKIGKQNKQMNKILGK